MSVEIRCPQQVEKINDFTRLCSSHSVLEVKIAKKKLHD